MKTYVTHHMHYGVRFTEPQTIVKTKTLHEMFLERGSFDVWGEPDTYGDIHVVTPFTTPPSIKLNTRMRLYVIDLMRGACDQHLITGSDGSPTPWSAYERLLDYSVLTGAEDWAEVTAVYLYDGSNTYIEETK